MIIGYARVSTEDQHLDAQTSALEAIDADRVFAEKISGTKKSRPGHCQVVCDGWLGLGVDA